MSMKAMTGTHREATHDIPPDKGGLRRGYGANPHPSRNSLIKKEGYDIPALGMDSILD